MGNRLGSYFIIILFLACGLGSLVMSWGVRDTAVLLAEDFVNHVPSPSEQILAAREAETQTQASGGWWAFGALFCVAGGIGLMVVARPFLKEMRLGAKVLKGKGGRGRQRPYPPTLPHVPQAQQIPQMPISGELGDGSQPPQF